MKPPPTHIGLVFNYGLEYCRRVLRGIRAYAETQPHWTLTGVPPEAQALKALRSSPLDGLIAHVFSDPLAATLRRWRKPLVNVSNVLRDPGFPRVGSDQVLIGRLAASHLLERGLEHFGFIGHPEYATAVDREVGFRQVLEAAGHKVASYHERKALPFEPWSSMRTLDAKVRRWLLAFPKPAGVLAAHDAWALQTVEACRLAGLHVPEDVAIVGVDNDALLCELARPSLSSVAVPAERIGYEAAELLERLLAGAEPPRQDLVIPPLGVITRRSSDTLVISDPDVAAALRFIRDHGHWPLTVDDVLREVPVSRRSLERRFRRVLQRGLAEEIRRVQMEQAKNLLIHTDLSMPAVAQRSGFADASYLSVVFRRETGLTPTAYRRQFRLPPDVSEPVPNARRDVAEKVRPGCV